MGRLKSENTRGLLSGGRLYGHKDITVTTSSATLSALLTTASITIDSETNYIVLLPKGTVGCALGGAASVGSGTIDSNIAYRIDLSNNVIPDFRLIAGSNTVVTVVQKG